MRFDFQQMAAQRETLAAYTRQMHDGLAALQEVEALHRVFAILCEREGGSIVISAAELQDAQRLPKRGVTISTDPASGDTTITTHQR